MAQEVRYLAVEGAIGVGKTSLAEKLARRFDAELLLEGVEENPLLPLYYGDMARYAFNLQVWFLVQRSAQQRTIQGLRERGRWIVTDYLLAKDELFARLTLNERQYELYLDVAKELRTPHVRPDVVVYLYAPVEVLMERISRRGRGYERELSRGYVARVVRGYEELFATYDRTPLVRVDADKTNVVSDEAAFDRLVGELAAAVGMRV